MTHAVLKADEMLKVTFVFALNDSGITNIESDKMFQRKLNSAMLQSLRFMAQKPYVNPFAAKEIKLQHMPSVETIRHRNIDIHLSGRKVKCGDYEFIQTDDGYILCYIHGYITKREPKNAFYGVYYGAKSPLNSSGPVDGIQSLPHANQIAILRAIEKLPNIADAKKLCICTDCIRTIRMMDRLGEYSQNGYRSTYGTVLKTRGTIEAVNEAIRSRDDVRFRFLFTPGDTVYIMKEALRLATTSASASK